MKEFMGKVISKLKTAVRYSIHTWIFKCFLTAFLLELVLEILGRRSFIAGFMFLIHSPFVYIYNVSIIFFTMLFALFLRKRLFGMIIISSVWLICGIVNFVVLGYRVTPFAAIDMLMLGDVLSMLDVYLKKWQQVLILVAIVAAIAGLVVLFRKSPKFEGDRKVKQTMLACVLVWFAVSFLTSFNVKHNIISDDFANLGMAYQDYGFAYCFTNSIIDNGIGKPDDYSESEMVQMKADLDKIKQNGREEQPNIIFIQLESFFDPNQVEGLTLSENPIPVFTRLKEEYPSGYLTVPALGAGTANTEFEVLTGLKSSFFGAGEYPYKTTVNETPVESLCSILKQRDYGCYAIHNNKGSFYDRQQVYDQMGFDAFISLEYMYDVDYTSTGWAKDATLVDDIMRCLRDTEGQDLVYTISVQGHGRYPSDENACEDYIQVDYTNGEMIQPIHYYVNQIHEMDMMIGELIKELDAYGEDYVLVLYGDHLPSLELTEEQLPDSTLFQTEWVMVNNIDLKSEDEDLASWQLSIKLLDALNMQGGYAYKAQKLYTGEEQNDKLCMIAYDMLFGERYLYGGASPVPEGEMRYGVEPIYIEDVSVSFNRGDMVITGGGFNEFSVVYMDDEALETVYVNRETLVIEGGELPKPPSEGTEIAVKQVDESKRILSSTGVYLY